VGFKLVAFFEEVQLHERMLKNAASIIIFFFIDHYVGYPDRCTNPAKTIAFQFE
jgi:hypothetical protein